MSRLFNDASSEYLQNDNVIVGTMPFTMACWFYSDDTASLQTLMSVGDVGAAAVYHALQLAGATAGDPVRVASSTGTPRTAVTSTGYSANTWHHAAGTFVSGTSRAAFIDGASKGTNTGSASPTGLDSVAIGRLVTSAPSNYMSGRIAEAACWNVELTDAEVAILALGYSPLFVRPQNLVAYWPLLGRTSPEIDIVGGFGMTVTGAVVDVHPRVRMLRGLRTGIPTAGGAFTLTAAQGSYILAGQAAGLLAGRRLTAVQGSYALSGQAAGLNRGFAMAAAQGSYSLSGQNAGLLAARLLTAVQGSYTLSGQVASLLAGRWLSVQQGAYTLSGQAAGLFIGRALVAAQGTYTLSGQGATVRIARLLIAAQGTYVLSGQAAGLIYSPTGGSTLTAATGNYALTGQAANLLAARLITAVQGGYALSGQNAALLISRLLSAQPGSYALSGQSAGLRAARLLPAAQGSYALTGQTASLLAGRRLAASQGAYTLTGQAIVFLATRVLIAAYGSYALTGRAAGLVYSAAGPFIVDPDNVIYVVFRDRRVAITFRDRRK